MAREVEVKILLDKKEAILLKKWLKLNAKFKKEVRQLEYYLDNPAASFYYKHKLGFKDSAKYFRIRMEKEGASVCVKVFSIDLKTSASKNLDEVEFKVPDSRSAIKLFNYLGFTDKTTIDKDRKIYTVKNFEIVLDSVKGLGEFAEIEFTGKRSSYGKELESIYDLLRKIGFKKVRMQTRGYVSMLWNTGFDFTKSKEL